ncbi:MAG: hypothetical protein M3154_03490 [Candidatus Eremiobacteraeota bacterium]|nr:hypothetical protein [Candidatus Eremiobacteraeota bacterium]
MRSGPVDARAAIVRILLAAAMIFATRWLGWPAPAVVGAVAAVFIPTPARESVIAALLGWGALLAWAAFGGRASAVVTTLGALAGTPGSAAVAVAALLAGVTLAFGAGLAWAGATLTSGLLGIRTTRPPGHVTLSETAVLVPARPAKRAPAAQTP